ncbi:unnamed protein product [Rotaria socialis]
MQVSSISAAPCRPRVVRVRPKPILPNNNIDNAGVHNSLPVSPLTQKNLSFSFPNDSWNSKASFALNRQSRRQQQRQLHQRQQQQQQQQQRQPQQLLQQQAHQHQQQPKLQQQQQQQLPLRLRRPALRLQQLQLQLEVRKNFSLWQNRTETLDYNS